MSVVGKTLRVYSLSTAVAPLGSGLGGGVGSIVVAAAHQLLALGHAVQIITPAGSIADIPDLLTLPGRLTPTVGGRHYNDPISFDGDSFWVTALRRLAKRSRPGDAILNFSYDWLPLFLIDKLPCPLGALVSMGCRAWVESRCTLAHYGTALNAWLQAFAVQTNDARETKA